MITDNNISNWDGISKVVIFHTNDLDSIFATKITYDSIRADFDITDITLNDITTTYPVPMVTNNPVNDTVVIFIGKIPNMMYIDKTIEMVGNDHVMVLINNPTFIDYFYKYSKTMNIMGLMIAEFTLYELSYLYWKSGARFCDTDMHYKIIANNSIVIPVNGLDEVGTGWQHYYKRLVDNNALCINDRFNNAAFVGETYPVPNISHDDLVLYFGIKTAIPAIDDSSIEANIFWDEFYNSTPDPQIIQSYMDIGYTTQKFAMKKNIKDFKNFGFLGKLRKADDFDLVAINQPISGAWNFSREEIFNNYHIGVEFCFNGRMHYRIYRLGKDPNRYVPIRKIAESFGGSGNDRVGNFQTSGTLEILPTNKA